MVSAPNSLSMNAVNFQKAKSAPLVIKKNISTTPVQINKKTIDEGTMRKMLDEADQSWVDKGEIIQWLLDRGYDIEEPKTFMQKAGQIGKNIVWWTLWWLPALWPYLLGGAMKGLWSLWVAPWLPAQTKITQWMKDVWQELISRGEQASNITEKALWANPNDTSTQLARSVVPIASQIIASWPLGLTKAGAWAFQTAKAWIAARSLPTVAKGVAQWALVGWTEQAMFDVAQTGETTAKNVALWATVWGALPVVAPLVQSAGKYVKNVLPWKLVSSAEESVSKALAPTKKKMKQLTERISPEFLKKGIRGSKESMQKLAKENAEKFWIKIDEAIESWVLDDVVIPRWEVDKILHEAKLTTMVWNKVVNDTKYKVVAWLQDMISQFPEAIQWREARALRQILDEVVYATKGGIGAEDLTYKNGLVKAMANTLRSEISKVAPDLASLNKEFSFYRTLEQILDETITRQKPQSWMLRKWASILFAGQQEWIGNKIMWYVWSKVFLDATSSATWNTISAQLKYKLANAIARWNPIAVNEVVKIINKKHNAWLPEMKALPAPKATVVAPWWLPQVKQPIAPLTKPIQILETWKANIKQPSTTKPQTLPTKTEAPLVDIFEWKLKKLQSDPTLEKVPRVYLQRWKDRVIETKYGTITEMIPNNRWTIAKIKVGDNVYEASWLDFFEKKTDRIPQPPKEKIPLDNESSLTKMIRKGKKQALKISDGLSELWTTLDDMDAQQIKDFWELLRARNFDDARNKKRETLKAQVSKKAPKLPVATKTPLKQANRK